MYPPVVIPCYPSYSNVVLPSCAIRSLHNMLPLPPLFVMSSSRQRLIGRWYPPTISLRSRRKEPCTWYLSHHPISFSETRSIFFYISSFPLWVRCGLMHSYRPSPPATPKTSEQYIDSNICTILLPQFCSHTLALTVVVFSRFYVVPRLAPSCSFWFSDHFFFSSVFQPPYVLKTP